MMGTNKRLFEVSDKQSFKVLFAIKINHSFWLVHFFIDWKKKIYAYVNKPSQADYWKGADVETWS